MQSQITRTLAAAGDYAAGDILADDADNGEGTASSHEFAIAYESSEAVVTHAVITGSVDALVPRLALDLFTANPSASELDDNAAPTIAAADRSAFVGTLLFEALTDRGAISAAEWFGYMPFKFASGSRTLRGVLRTLDAFTNESAGMTVTITLHAETIR